MKLRILDNSIRLRLDRSELRQLLIEGRVERQILFGPSVAFTYALHAVTQAAPLCATLGSNRIDVHVELVRANAWAASDDAAIEAFQPAGAGELRLLLEKDFPCQHTDHQDSAEKFTPTTMNIGVVEHQQQPGVSRRATALRPK